MVDIKFGVRIPNLVLKRYFQSYDKLDFSDSLDIALLSEELGFHSIWVNDHLIFGDAILECWTTLSALASVTKKIRLGTLVLCNSFRHPPLLAKMAATLDFISNGRLEFGIGAGWNELEHKAYGLSFPSPSERLRRLSESIEICKRMWTEENPVYNGKYYHMDGAICSPKPVQKPHPPIMIGGKGEKLTLKLVAKYADKCNFSHLSPEEYAVKLNILKRYCERFGRAFDEIEKTWWGRAIVSDNKIELRRQIELLYRYSHSTLPFGEWYSRIKKVSIIGAPEECRRKIESYIDLGVTLFILRFGDIPATNGLRLFSSEIMDKFF